MDFPFLFTALDTTGDIVAFLVDWVPAILLIILLTAALMWLLAYMVRRFEYMSAQSQESRWLTRDTLEFVRKFLALVAIVFYFVGVLTILQYRSDAARAVLAAVIGHFPAAFVILFTLFVGAVFVRVLHNFAAYLRGDLRIKPKAPAPARALATTEIVLKYVIYLIAAVTAVVGGVQALPASDQVVKDAFTALIRPEQWTTVLLILGGALLVALVADRIADSLFDDLKRRGRKFNARVVDQFKTATRLVTLFVVGVAALFLVLNLVLDSTRLLVFAVGFIALVIVGALAIMDTLQEAIAGVNLMMADPFDVGDRVKIGDDLVCDVVAFGLTMTQVRTLKGELVNLPNSRLRHEPVMNFNRSAAYAIFVDVAVDIAVPHDRVREVLLEAAKRTAGIVDAPAAEVYGKEMDGRSIEYQLLAYTKDPERMKQIKSDLVFNLQDALQRFGVVPGVPSP